MEVDNPPRAAYSICVDNQNIAPVASSAVSDFIDRLIAEKNFPDLTPEVKGELKRDIAERLDNFIAARVIAALSDEKVLEFENMLKERKPENEVQAFVAENIPDFTGFLTQTLLEFKEVYLGLIPVPEAGETSDKQE